MLLLGLLASRCIQPTLPSSFPPPLLLPLMLLMLLMLLLGLLASRCIQPTLPSSFPPPLLLPLMLLMLLLVGRALHHHLIRVYL